MHNWKIYKTLNSETKLISSAYGIRRQKLSYKCSRKFFTQNSLFLMTYRECEVKYFVKSGKAPDCRCNNENITKNNYIYIYINE